MPRMGGLEAVGAIHEILPDARFILSTGYGGRVESEELSRSGITVRALAKPYTTDALLRAIREILDAPR